MLSFEHTSSSEVIPVIFHIGILVITAGECETKPTVNLIWVTNRNVSVIVVHLSYSASLEFISSSFVIQDGID